MIRTAVALNLFLFLHLIGVGQKIDNDWRAFARYEQAITRERHAVCVKQSSASAMLICNERYAEIVRRLWNVEYRKVQHLYELWNQQRYDEAQRVTDALDAGIAEIEEELQRLQSTKKFSLNEQ